MFQSFWRWYERHRTLNIGLAAGLFLWQLAHLLWLTTDVVIFQLTGDKAFDISPIARFFIIIADYTEIPALVSVSLVYIAELRQHFSKRNVFLLILLNSQWLHLFWITDTYVLRELSVRPEAFWPTALFWVAVLIDYFELPVMADVLRKLIRELRGKRFCAIPMR